MRYSASEKLEIIQIVEQSHLPVGTAALPSRENILVRSAMTLFARAAEFADRPASSHVPQHMRDAPGGFQKFLRGVQYVRAEAQQALPRVIWLGHGTLRRLLPSQSRNGALAPLRAAESRSVLDERALVCGRHIFRRYFPFRVAQPRAYAITRSPPVHRRRSQSYDRSSEH
jgi:hypothetical protein